MHIDFHSHILPCLDDGAESPEISLAMLHAEAQQGVGRVVLTPHFYPQQESVDSFLHRRERAFARLCRTAREPLTELVLGAEVAMTKQLCREDITPLCVAGTRTLLLELPYTSEISTWIQDVRTLIHQNAVKIVLAHVERYQNMWSKTDFKEIMALPVLKQVNCGSLLCENPFRRRRILHMIAEEQVHVLGTDAHNCTLRPVNMEAAMTLLRKKGMEMQWNRMMACAQKLT